VVEVSVDNLLDGMLISNNTLNVAKFLPCGRCKELYEHGFSVLVSKRALRVNKALFTPSFNERSPLNWCPVLEMVCVSPIDEACEEEDDDIERDPSITDEACEEEDDDIERDPSITVITEELSRIDLGGAGVLAWDAHRPLFYSELNANGYLECLRRLKALKRRYKNSVIK
jgi:hypothetical protein